MSKYVRIRPRYEKEVNSDFYAFDSPSDYVAFDCSEFATPEEYLRTKKIKKEALERDRFFAERLEMERIKKKYGEFFSLNVFSSDEEFCEFVYDFYGKNWNSVHKSKTLSQQDLDIAQDCAKTEISLGLNRLDWRPILSYEKDLIRQYLSGNVDYAESFNPNDIDLNEALEAHLREKSIHENRCTMNIRANNQRIRYALGDTMNSFVLVNSRNEVRKCISAETAGFIFRRYQRAKQEFEDYNNILFFYPYGDRGRLAFQNSILPSLDRKRYAETIRRLKSQIKFAKHYGSFSIEDGRYLKKEHSRASSSPVVEAFDSTKKVPMHSIGYVNHRFDKPCKVDKCSSQKKLSATAIHIIAVPFKPCHIAPSFAKH